jgi:RNA polymerase sigma factor (sigma-70 family)
MEHPDQKYVYALVNNDSIMLKELYDKFSDKIRRLVVANSGSEMDAADIFQDALLSIYNKAKTGNFILTCPFEAFLYIICKNRWINELGKRKLTVTIDESKGYAVGEDSFRSAEECILLHERKDLLMKKLVDLGKGCRQLLYLSWSGCSMEKVAEMLNITYGYARKRKSECMEKLVTLVRHSPHFDSLKW